MTFEKSFPSPNVWAYFRSIRLGASLQGKKVQNYASEATIFTPALKTRVSRGDLVPRYTYSSEIFSFIPNMCLSQKEKPHRVFLRPLPSEKAKLGKDEAREKILFARPSQKCVSRASKYAFMFHFSAQKHAERAKKINRRFSPISQRMLSLKERITRQAGP